MTRAHGRGRIGIFNRSQYEEVLVVRVHEELLAAERIPAVARDHGIWARRYREINDWERYLVDTGSACQGPADLSKREQAKRSRVLPGRQGAALLGGLPAGLRGHAEPDQHEVGAVYVVPTDHKWFSRLATAAVLVTALDAINPRYPAADPSVAGVPARSVSPSSVDKRPAAPAPRAAEIRMIRSGWPRSGCRRSTGRRWPTPATTSRTTPTSTWSSEPWPTSTTCAPGAAGRHDPPARLVHPSRGATSP